MAKALKISFLSNVQPKGQIIFVFICYKSVAHATTLIPVCKLGTKYTFNNSCNI